MSVYANLYMDQGADFDVVVTIEDGLGNLFDLTGYTGRAQMRKSYNSSNAIDIHVEMPPFNPKSGEVSLRLSPEETSAIKAGRYVYDVEITADDVENENTTLRVIEGQIIVTPQVTK